MENNILNRMYFHIKYVTVLLFMISSTLIKSQDSLNCTKIGQWAEGPCYAVDANENHTFINNGCYLDILDTSDSTNFNLITKYLSRGFIYDIKIKDTIAYLAINGLGLSILNISDINNPQEMGFLELYGYNPKIELYSDKLYYSTYDLYLINISDPKSPFIQKKYNVDWTRNNLKIRDNYLYVACDWCGFKIFDISNPDSLIEVYHNDNFRADDVDLKDNYACLAAGGYVTILDISSPSEPITIGEIHSSVRACRFYKDMIICGGYNLYSIDISDPTKPEILDNYYLNNYLNDLIIYNNKIYISHDKEGFKLFNIDNNGNFSLYGSYDTAGYSMGIAVKDSIAYISQYRGGIKLIDISDLTSPKYLKSINEGSYVETIKIKDNYLYCSDSGLRIFDISDLENPVEVSYININTQSYKFKIIGNTIYLASGKKGLIIIDISDLNNVTIVSEIDISGSTFGVDIKDNTAYIANEDGMHVIDISDPGNPVEVKYYDKQKNIREINVLDNFVYLGSWNYGVRIFDISNLDSISIVRYINTKRGYSIFNKDNFVYVGAGYNGILIFDITDVANPVKIGSYNTPGKVYDMAFSGNHIFLADYNSGMIIIDFDICLSLNINSIQQNVSCHGQCNGNIQITDVENTVGTIRYSWSTGQTGSSIDGLCKGTYFVTITDDNNCEIIDSFYIGEPPELAFNNIVKNDITGTTSKGSIQVNVAGGTPDYSFEWSGPNDFTASTQNISGLDAGCYTLTVTDANGCTLVSDEICIEDEKTAVENIYGENDFQIFPNPANDFIHIRLNSDQLSQKDINSIEFYSLSGKNTQVMNSYYTDKIDVSKLENGVYFLEIKTNKGSFFRKIILLR